MKPKSLKYFFILLINSSVMNCAFLKFPFIGGKSNRMSPITTSRLTDSEMSIESETISSWTNQQNSLIPDSSDEKEDNENEAEYSSAPISKTVRLLPSIFPSKRPAETNVKRNPPTSAPPVTTPPSTSFDFISKRWIGNDNRVRNQLRTVTNDLLNLMKFDNDQRIMSFPKSRTDNLPRSSNGEVFYFKEITDRNILAVLDQFPTRNVPLNLVFETLRRIWHRVVTTKHRAIFEEVMKWAIQIVSHNYPRNYFSLVEFIIKNNIQYPSYQQALLKSHLMSFVQVQLIVDLLLSEFLKEIHAGEYAFYGKFNIHFLEIALNYPNFSKLPFIENAVVTQSILPTPTLRLIYYSAPLIEMLSTKAQIDSDKVVEIVDAMKDHIIESKLSPFMLAEQYQIILNMKRDKIADLDETSRFVLLNNIAESLEATLVARKMYPDIPHKREYALLVHGSFDDLLLLFIRNLKPILINDEFVSLVSLADRTNPDDPFGTFLTLLGSISVPKISWYHRFEYFKERSLRIHIYVDVILSIEDQQLVYDPETHSSDLRSFGKSRSINWIVPHSLIEKNYEMLSIADLLIIPLLFIQRVFNRDCRDSPVIHRYLRLGKPNYYQFLKIFNELLEDQRFGNRCPAVDFIYSKSYF